MAKVSDPKTKSVRKGTRKVPSTGDGPAPPGAAGSSVDKERMGKRVAELAASLEELKGKSEAERKAFEAREGVMTSDLEQARKETSSIREERDGLSTEISALKAEKSSVEAVLMAKMAEAVQKAASVEEECHTAQSEGKRLGGELTSLREQFAMASAEAETLKGDLSEANAAKDTLGTELESSRQKAEKAEGDLSRVSDEKDTLEKELQAFREKAEKAVDLLKTEIEEVTKRAEALTGERDELLQVKESQAKQLAVEKEDRGILLEKTGSLELELEKARGRAEGEIESLKTKFDEATRKSEAHSQEGGELREAKEGLQRDLETATKERDGLQEKVEGLQKELETAKKDREALEGKSAALEGQLSEVREKVEQEGGTLKTDLEKAVQESEALEKKLADKEREAEEEIGKLRSELEKSAGAATEAKAAEEALQAKLDGMAGEAEAATGDKDNLEASKEALNAELEAVKKERDALLEKAAALRKRPPRPPRKPAPPAEKKEPAAPAKSSAPALSKEVLSETKDPGEVLSHLFQDPGQSGPITADALLTKVRGYMAEIAKDPGKALEFEFSSDPADYCRQHAERVSRLAVFLTWKADLPDSEVEAVGLAALLHDVGMAMLPDALIQKAGPLSPEETARIREHPELGATAAASLEGLDSQIPGIIREHHESVSGKGYPQGIPYDDVHPLAKIVALVDCYDAMASPRVCPGGAPPAGTDTLTLEEVAAAQAIDFPIDLSQDELTDANPYVSMSGVVQRGMAAFDAAFVRIFFENMGVFPLGSFVELKGGAVARIAMTHLHAVKKPILEVVLDSNGQRPSEPLLIDLSKTDASKIHKPLSGHPA